MRFYLFALIFALFYYPSLAQNQPKNAAVLDNYFNTLAKHEVASGAFSIAKDGKIIYNKAIGYANKSKQIKATMDTRFRIGSISKMFTSALIFKAIEEHLLTPNQRLSDFYPNIKHSDKITIDLLLKHRTGIHNITNDEDYFTYHTQALSQQELLALIIKKGSDFVPNTQTAYSNSNYILLTFILEKVYKMSFSNLLKQKIVDPIGLKNTYMGGTHIDEKKQEAQSYNAGGSWLLEKYTQPSIPLGAGAIVSTTQDLLAFINALFKHKIISDKSLQLMMKQEDGIGSGIFSFPYGIHTGWGHSGGIDGFRSMIGYFPEISTAFAFTLNNADMNTNDLSVNMMHWASGKEITIPQFSTFKLENKDIQQYVGQYEQKKFNLKLNIFKKNTTLMGQIVGQPTFKLTPIAKDEFEIKSVAAKLKFKPKNKSLTLFQSGMELEFTQN